jgi:NADH-quinone oxidoreductase subunit M
VALFATTGLILGAVYMLWLYRRVVFGKLTKDDLKTILDLDKREMAMFVPLVLVVLWMGVYPSSFLGVIHGSVANLVDHFHTSVAPVAAATGVTR